jgi:hypothetical protein
MRCLSGTPSYTATTELLTRGWPAHTKAWVGNTAAAHRAQSGKTDTQLAAEQTAAALFVDVVSGWHNPYPSTPACLLSQASRKQQGGQIKSADLGCLALSPCLISEPCHQRIVETIILACFHLPGSRCSEVSCQAAGQNRCSSAVCCLLPCFPCCFGRFCQHVPSCVHTGGSAGPGACCSAAQLINDSAGAGPHSSSGADECSTSGSSSPHQPPFGTRALQTASPHPAGLHRFMPDGAHGAAATTATTSTSSSTGPFPSAQRRGIVLAPVEAAPRPLSRFRRLKDADDPAKWKRMVIRIPPQVGTSPGNFSFSRAAVGARCGASVEPTSKLIVPRWPSYNPRSRSSWRRRPTRWCCRAAAARPASTWPTWTRPASSACSCGRRRPTARRAAPPTPARCCCASARASATSGASPATSRTRCTA